MRVRSHHHNHCQYYRWARLTFHTMRTYPLDPLPASMEFTPFCYIKFLEYIATHSLFLAITRLSNICLYRALRYHIVTMNLTFFLGITAAMTIVIAGSSLGLDFVSAQMADNATMGNLTGGN